MMNVSFAPEGDMVIKGGNRTFAAGAAFNWTQLKNRHSETVGNRQPVKFRIFSDTQYSFLEQAVTEVVLVFRTDLRLG
jgi:hypothetical protein